MQARRTKTTARTSRRNAVGRRAGQLKRVFIVVRSVPAGYEYHECHCHCVMIDIDCRPRNERVRISRIYLFLSSPPSVSLPRCLSLSVSLCVYVTAVWQLLCAAEISRSICGAECTCCFALLGICSHVIDAFVAAAAAAAAHAGHVRDVPHCCCSSVQGSHRDVQAYAARPPDVNYTIHTS